MQPELKQYLEENNIEYILHEHPAVFTVPESEKLCQEIPGLRGKNLFMKDREGDQGFFLVILPGHKRLNIKALRKQLNIKKLSFADEEAMWTLLKLTPGSVSPFGLINDTENQITVIIDQEIWDADVVNFHPNINTASMELKQGQFHKFINSVGNTFK